MQSSHGVRPGLRANNYKTVSSTGVDFKTICWFVFKRIMQQKALGSWLLLQILLFFPAF